jgi:arabinose-5-phosphate isomerase
MSTDAASSTGILSQFEQLRFAREILRAEGQAVLTLADRLHDDFCRAVDLVLRCQGNVIVTGMGKAGLVGQKVAATLGSTGTSSHFVHPGEAIHGDLGRIHPRDIVVALSFSGETEEIVRLLPSLCQMKIPIVAITRSNSSELGRTAQVTLELGPLKEACSLGLAPSTSTTSMLAICDALALVVSRMRGFNADDFARFHPGGSLGRKLAKVEDVMRPLPECRVAHQSGTVREVYVQLSRPGRRTGAIILVDGEGKLAGIFTDSDLARLLEGKHDMSLDDPIHEVMTQAPTTVTLGTRLPAAIEMLAIRKISELPVVDKHGKPLGMIDITDVVGIETAQPARNSTSAVSSVDDRPPTVPFPNP